MNDVTSVITLHNYCQLAERELLENTFGLSSEDKYSSGDVTIMDSHV